MSNQLWPISCMSFCHVAWRQSQAIITCYSIKHAEPWVSIRLTQMDLMTNLFGCCSPTSSRNKGNTNATQSLRSIAPLHHGWKLHNVTWLLDGFCLRNSSSSHEDGEAFGIVFAYGSWQLLLSWNNWVHQQSIWNCGIIILLELDYAMNSWRQVRKQ